MNALVEQLLYFSNWKVILAAGVLLFVFYLFVGVFSNFLLAKKNLFTPHKMLNSQFNYPPQKAFELLRSYDDKERSVYIKFTYPCDVAVALLYGVFFTLALIGIYKQIFTGTQLLALFIFPLAGALCNIIEDMQIVYMLRKFDAAVIHKVAKVTNLFTMAKLILLQGALALVAAGLVILLLKRVMTLL